MTLPRDRPRAHPEAEGEAPCDHRWYERFVNPDEGGPGYRTECIRCGTHDNGAIMTVDETIAHQQQVENAKLRAQITALAQEKAKAEQSYPQTAVDAMNEGRWPEATHLFIKRVDALYKENEALQAQVAALTVRLAGVHPDANLQTMQRALHEAGAALVKAGRPDGEWLAEGIAALTVERERLTTENQELKNALARGQRQGL